MTYQRVAISPDARRALQIEAAITGETIPATLERLILTGISQKAKDALIAIGETSATAKKPKSDKARLTDNPQALQAIRDLWQSGVRSRAAIARKIDYPKSTVAENIKRMLAAGELQEEGEGEESTY